MGCASSNDRDSGRTLPRNQRRRDRSGEECVTVLYDRHRGRLIEEAKQRDKAEKTFADNLQLEKESLRAQASLMMNRECSWSDLLENLEPDVLDSLRQDTDSFRKQQLQKKRVRSRDGSQLSWVFLNNKSTITESDMDFVSDFFEELLSIVKRSYVSKLFLMASHESEKLRSGTSNETDSAHRLQTLARLHVRDLYTVTSSIPDSNLHNFDFPSGLITVSGAKSVVDLYRRGGRLSNHAVHKLLRVSQKSLKEKPNISKVKVGPGDRLTIVGDLHGQIADLLHIIEQSGMPSKTNKYIFNGDFVDRGEHGLEVVSMILALHCALPDSVFLNRGNHEDFAICNAYGFQVEVYEKYDEVIFGMFIEVFQSLPLFALINDSVFVVHGGLFHDTSITLEDLEKIQRHDFTLLEMPEGGETVKPFDKIESPTEYYKQLQRDALWSDPCESQGVYLSPRGAGVWFGPDVAKVFMNLNDLKMIIRSHECVRSGCQLVYPGEDNQLLMTLFSASNYGGQGNSAAFLVFEYSGENEAGNELAKEPSTLNRIKSSLDSPAVHLDGIMDFDSDLDPSTRSTASKKEAESDTNKSEAVQVEGTSLAYTVRYFYIDRTAAGSAMYQDSYSPVVNEDTYLEDDRTVIGEAASDIAVLDENHSHTTELKESLCKVTTAGKETLNGDSGKNEDTVFVGSTISLFERILWNKFALHDAFVKSSSGTDVVSDTCWAEVMEALLDWNMDWVALIPLIVPNECIVKTPGPGNTNTCSIAYAELLDFFTLPNLAKQHNVSLLEDSLLADSLVDREGAAVTNRSSLATLSKDSSSSSSSTSASSSSKMMHMKWPAKTFPATSHSASSSRDFSISGIEISAVALTVVPEGSKEPIEEEPVAVAPADYICDMYDIMPNLLHLLYPRYLDLMLALEYLDKNRDGVISPLELIEGVIYLNKSISAETTRTSTKLEISSIEKVLDIFKFGIDESIDINFFFEMFRLSERNEEVPRTHSHSSVGFDSSMKLYLSSGKSTSSMSTSQKAGSVLSSTMKSSRNSNRNRKNSKDGLHISIIEHKHLDIHIDLDKDVDDALFNSRDSIDI